MAVAVSSRPRPRVDGKFFRLGDQKLWVKGVSYGPFQPNAAGQAFASPEQTARDFAQIRELGANLVRIYHVPAQWFLDLAAQQRLLVMIDIPWNQHLCFLDASDRRAAALEAVRRAVFSCARHPAIFAFSVANEIPPDVVRWSGTRAIADFIDELVQEAKRADPDCLCTFVNFPPTEFLSPRTVDFVCFNVYLHNEQALANYLSRLQMQADTKPLLLGETGVDSLREGEDRQAELLSWQIERAFRSGLAGTVVFTFTDDWWRGGRLVEDWKMGLTTVDRQPRPAFHAVQKQYQIAPAFPLATTPKVSVVVCTYNSERTLPACLESLERLRYPKYEIILVDDGSKDSTPKIAMQHPKVRYFRHDTNLGLSVARNTGIAAATGEIIAYTDADCRADEDWLYYLVADFQSGEFAAMGGPNLLPADDSAIAAAVMASPGGPAHVMLTDRKAEHIPGCNMAIRKAALEELGGFDPVFHKAGDDVDICWRLQQAGYQIGFSPAAFVWHHRRSTVRDYLRQQRGYGEAEAILVRKHPECFNSLGGSVWHGRIYNSSQSGVLVRPPIIYRGLFGSAPFQSLYAASPAFTLMLCTALEYHLLATLPLWIFTVTFHQLWPLALASLLIPVTVCCAAGAQAVLAKRQSRWWSRPLVALLFFMQPIIRGWARYQGRLGLSSAPVGPQPSLDSEALKDSRKSLGEVAYWAENGVDRLSWVTELLRRLEREGWPNKVDTGWSDHDVEIYGSRWSSLLVSTVAENHPRGRQLLRCRLRGRWSLQAKFAFWTLTGVELLVLGFVTPRFHWLWLLLVTLPMLAWLLHRQRRQLQSIVTVFLDNLAKEWKLIKISPNSAKTADGQAEKPS